MPLIKLIPHKWSFLVNYRKKAFKTSPQIEEYMLIVMDKSTDEEHLSQPIQTNNKQFKIAVTFLIGYNVTDENNKFYFAKSISDEDGFIQINIPLGAYQIKSLNNEIKRIIGDEEHYTDANYPFTFKPNCSTPGSIIAISTQGPVITFVADYSIRNLLGFIATTIDEEYNLPPNPVEVLSFDNIFPDCDIAHSMIFKSKRSGIIQNVTMDNDPGYNFFDKIKGEVKLYLMEPKILFQVFVSN